MSGGKFKLFLTPGFSKDMRKLGPGARRQVEAALVGLLSDPFSGKKLKNLAVGQWRIRVGEYRIRYDIDGTQVVLLRVRHRKDIYRH